MDKRQQVEQLLDRVLRELPLRRAPQTLERRVLSELARRAALPWWRQSFAHWPRLARVAFVAVCGMLSGLTIVGGASLVAGIGSARALSQSFAFIGASGQAVASLVRAIPPAWLYEGVGLATVLYGLLFALGATAYRTLYLDA